MQDTAFELGGKKYRSRLIVGTGKYRDFAETRSAVEESGAEIVTVAVRRVNITDRGKENLSVVAHRRVRRGNQSLDVRTIHEDSSWRRHGSSSASASPC